MAPASKIFGAITWLLLCVPCLAVGCTRAREVQQFCSAYAAQCVGHTPENIEVGEQEPFTSQTPNIFFAGDDIVIINDSGVSQNSLQELLSTIMAGGEQKSKLLTLTSLLEILISSFENIDAEFIHGVHDDVGDGCDRFLSLWSNVRDEYQNKMIPVPHKEEKHTVSRKPTYPETIFVGKSPSTVVSPIPSEGAFDYTIPRKFYSFSRQSKPEDFGKEYSRLNIASVAKPQKHSVSATSRIPIKPIKDAVHVSSFKPFSFVVEKQYPPTIKYPRPSFRPFKSDSKEPQTFTAGQEVMTTPAVPIQQFTVNFEKSRPAGVISYSQDRKQRPHFSKTTPTKFSAPKAPEPKPVDHYYSKPKFELGSKIIPSVNISKPLTVTYDQYKPVVKQPHTFGRPELNFSFGKKTNSQVYPVPLELNPEVFVKVIEIQDPAAVRHSQENIVKPTISSLERNYATTYAGGNNIVLPSRDPHGEFSYYPDTSRFSTPKRPDAGKLAASSSPNTGVSNFFSKFAVPSRNKVQYQSTISIQVPDNKASPEDYKPHHNTFSRPSVTVHDDHRPTSNLLPTQGTSWVQALYPKVKNYSTVNYEFITQTRDPQVIDVIPIGGSRAKADTFVSHQRPFAIQEPWKELLNDGERLPNRHNVQKPQSPKKTTTGQREPSFIQPIIDHSIKTMPYEIPLINEETALNTGGISGPSGDKFNNVKGNLHSSGRIPGRFATTPLLGNRKPAQNSNYPELELSFLGEGKKFDTHSGSAVQHEIGGSFNLPGNVVPLGKESSSIPTLIIDYLDDYKNAPRTIRKELLSSFDSQAYDYRDSAADEYLISDGFAYENYENVGLSEIGNSFVGQEDNPLPSYLVTDYLAELEYGYHDDDGHDDYYLEYVSRPESQSHTYDQFSVLSGTGDVEDYSNVNSAGTYDPNDSTLELLYEYDLPNGDYLNLHGHRGNSHRSLDGSSLEIDAAPLSYIDSLSQIDIGTDFTGAYEESNYQEDLLSNPNLSTDFYSEYGNRINYRTAERFPSQPHPLNQQPGIPQWDYVDGRRRQINFPNVPSVEYTGAGKSYYDYGELFYDDPPSPSTFQEDSGYAEEYFLADSFPSKPSQAPSSFKSQNILNRPLSVEYGSPDSDELVLDYLPSSNYFYDDLQSSGAIDIQNSEGSFSYPRSDSRDVQNSWDGLSNFQNSRLFNSGADGGEISSYQLLKDASAHQAGVSYESYSDSYDTQQQGDYLLELESFANSDYLDRSTDVRSSYGEQFGSIYGDRTGNYETLYSSYDEASSDLSSSYELGLMANTGTKNRFGRDLSEVSRETGAEDALELCTFVSTGCEVYCDGFWIVIQDRNRETSETFDRNLRDYSTGFGNVHSGYWMGLDCLNFLTTQRPHQLLVEVTDERGRVASALYESFSVDNYYQLHLGRFVEGSAGDGLRASDGALFSTFDRDVDYAQDNCAARLGGGWWYYDCQLNGPESFLNGDFFSDVDFSGVRWGTWSTSAPIVSTRMLIKPSLFLPAGYEAYDQY